MEKSLKGTRGETLCQGLYQGKLCYQTVCSSCKTVSEREEDFYDLIVQILNCNDLVKSLHEYCKREVLKDDSAYDCSVCRCKQTAYRGISLKNLPDILTFSCVRFRMDRTTNWQREKLFSRHEFPLLLDMGCFLEGSNINEVPDEGVVGLKENMLWINDFLEAVDEIVATILPKYSDDPVTGNREMLSLGSLNPQDASYIEERMGSMIDRVCSGKANVYQLHAVILHRGSAFSGHYFAYIRDNLGEGTWGVDSVDPKACKTDCFLHEDVLYIRKDSPMPNILDMFKLYGAAATHTTLQVSVLGPQYIAAGREMWNSSFRSQYGTLNGYVKQHQEVLTFKQNEIILKCHRYKTMEILPVQRYEAVYSKKISANVSVTATTGGEVVSDTTHDEVLARELQSQLNIEGNEEVASAKDESNDNWQEVSPRNKKHNSPARNMSKNKGNNSPMSKKKPDPVPAATAPVKKSQLFHDIVSKYLGCYYEFNDSVVKPMTVSDVANAFEGKDSAYMLIYTKVQGRSTVPTPPVLWERIVEQRNAELTRLKQEYEDSNHSVQLTIYCASDMVYEPLISPLLTVQPDKTPVVITVDTRASLEELYQQLEQIAIAKHASYSMVVSEMVAVDTAGFHILDVLPLTGTVETVTGVSNCKNLLVWNGESIQDHAVAAIGSVAAPLKFNISVLASKKESDTDLTPVMSSDLLFQLHKLPPVAVASTFDLYVSKAATIDEFLGIIRQRVMLETKSYDRDLVVHDITESDQSRTTPSQGKNNLTKKVTSNIKGVSNISSKLQQLVTSLTSNELLVEDVEARGVYSSSLAEAEMVKRSHSMTIHVDMDIKPVIESLGVTALSIPVYSEATIQQLKQYIFQPTALSEEEVTAHYRFRLGFNKGEDIVVDESQTVAALGLKHNSSITLENGTKPVSNSQVFIRIVAVSGNSTSTMKCADMGVRGQEVELQVDTKDTMQSVRDRAAVLLYPGTYSAGWTTNPSMNTLKRLRKTNQFLEAGELVAETLDGFKKTELVTVSKCSLGNGSVLLLEDGPPPVKGQVEFRLLLWNPSGGSREEAYQLPITALEELQATMLKVNTHKRSHFIPVGELQAHQDWSIAELQRQIYEILQAQSLPVTPVDAAHIVIREMRADTMLPGKNYCYTAEGIKKPLKAHHLVTDQELVVEVAPPDHETVLPNNAFRVWVQHVITPSTLNSNDLAMFHACKPLPDLVPVHANHLSECSAWPPKQVLVNGGPRPTLAHLRRPIAAALGLDFDSLVVFKYVPKTASWIEFINSKNSKKVDYVSVAPYMLKDGDLVCALNCSSTSTTTKLTINRLEDYYEQHMKKVAEINKGNSKVKKVVRVVTREALLTIGGDDSDDDR